ncbi:MAG: right-handed parallel beta-helix repeat-containing protein [Methanomicrobiales archaeon]
MDASIGKDKYTGFTPTVEYGWHIPIRNGPKSSINGALVELFRLKNDGYDISKWKIFLTDGQHKVYSTMGITDYVKIVGRKKGSAKIIGYMNKNKRLFHVTNGKLLLYNLDVYKKGTGGAIYSTNSELYIENCIFNNNAAVTGGAIHARTSKVTIKDSSFESNSAQEGGAIYIGGVGLDDYFKTIRIENCQFNHNYAFKNGGAVMISYLSSIMSGNRCGNIYFVKNKFHMNTISLYNRGEACGGAICINYRVNAKDHMLRFIQVMDCEFDRNFADYGAAIYNNIDYGNLEINGSIFSNNTAYIGGGAIYNKRGRNKFKVINSEFKNNLAKVGGCIYNEFIRNPYDILVKDCKFIDNSTNCTYNHDEKDENGGVFYNKGHLIIESCTFLNNNSHSGGVIYSTDKETITTIKKCEFNGNHANYGGAIYNTSGSSIIVNQCKFTENNSKILGGAIYNCGSEIKVYNSTFSKNITDYGGAVYNTMGSSLFLNECELTENNSRIRGGAIYNSGSELTVYNSIFTKNRAIQGGVIYNWEHGLVIVNDSDFTINSASDASVFHNSAEKTNATFNNCTFTGNTADLDGGVMINRGELKIVKCTFDNNKAQNNGGAIFSSGTLTIDESNFTQNQATNGGAIYNSGSELTVYNSIFTKNRAIQGGVIYNWEHGLVIVNDSDFTINSASDASVFHNSAEKTNATFNNCTFTGNTADLDGGVMINRGVLKIVKCTFYNNKAQNNGGAIFNSGKLTIDESNFIKNQATYGGVLYNCDNASVNILKCSFIQNSAEQGGVIHNSEGVSVFLTDSNFTGNESIYNGGAIYNSGLGTTTTIENCEFNSNSSNYGGAFYNCMGGSIVVTGSRFNENIATVYGGAIYNQGPYSIITINNSNFTENSAEQGEDIYNCEDGVIETEDPIDADSDIIMQLFPTPTVFLNNIR